MKSARIFWPAILGIGALACGQTGGSAVTDPNSVGDAGREAASSGGLQTADGGDGSPDSPDGADSTGSLADSGDGAAAGEAGNSEGGSDTGSGSSIHDSGAESATGDSGLQESGAEASTAAPGVRIVGRTASGTNGSTRFEWSGVSIAARFSGTQVSIQLNDGSNLNEFAVLVDGNPLNNLVTRSGTTTYQLANGLATGTHDLLVWRRTEASYSYTEFVGLTGFSPGGALLAPPLAPARRIEIIGDSISCGYGIEGTSTCSNAQLESIENNYLAYGSVAARDVGADVVTIAWSGIGIYRNYGEVGPSTNTMPQRYDFAIPTDITTTWDYAKYQPQAVVINLTSNDFSTMGDPGAQYVNAFVSFVQHVRSKYPQAYIFLVIEWRGNGSDSAPDVNSVVSMIKNSGDNSIESFDIRPFANGNGCQGHPDVAGSQAMGDALAAEIKRVLNW